MRDIRVGVAQFEAKDRDKSYNLGRIRELTRRAADLGAELVSFHECCISGYTFLMSMGKSEIVGLAEPVPDGPSVRALEGIASEFGIAVAAGLLEISGDRIYNTYVIVSPDGFVEKFSKLHPFISEHLSPGDVYKVFDFLDCTWSVLICYDNNLPENVRITTMMGAEIILMPHVTCGLPLEMPGSGKIDPRIWQNRHQDPVRCRQEFEGPKGRGWLMRWLPCRAYENGIYALFSNAVGVDHDTIKTGNAMVLDPHGEILVESHALGDDVVVGLLTADKIGKSLGRCFVKARKPELYERLVQPHPPGETSVTLPGWELEAQRAREENDD
jgi:predicted amidohydrolase